MKIAFCASEVFPFAKTGGLADVCSDLPQALEKLGHEVVIFLPFYGCIDPDQYRIQRINARLCRTTLGENITVYLVEHDPFFERDGLYGDGHGDYPDNLERFQYFCLQVLKYLRTLQLQVDVLHCHDWHTALIPVYLKEKFFPDPFYARIKTVLTIHNLAYQGLFPKEKFSQLDLEANLFSLNGFEFFGQVNLLKAGILFADKLTTVSPHYAQEILTTEYGCGLEGVLRMRKKDLRGILNGLNLNYWNPKTDPFVDFRFSSKDFKEGKSENKKELLKEFRLPSKNNIALFGFVARLTGQKGLDLIFECEKEFFGRDICVIFQGVGEQKYHEKLKGLLKRHPKKTGVYLRFDEHMAHDIYAGSDFFLIPSIFEPCGLSQMISMRYGTIPLAFKTGGLVDTIKPFQPRNGYGNGFFFDSYEPRVFLKAVDDALKVYQQKEKWSKIVENALSCNFSWEKSAQEYVKMYEEMICA